MGAKSDRSFPCILSSSQRFSEQRHVLQEPESDYVFFSPVIGLKQNGARSLDLESRCGALPEVVAWVSEDVGAILQETQ